MINIIGLGQAGGKYEQDLNDMEVKPTADMALKYKGTIVGVKSAHYSGPEWDPFTRAVEVGKIANIPVMVDFGSSRPERPLYDLLNKVFRPGDIFTHVYGGNRGEQDPKTLGPSQALIDGRKRGVLFDVGNGRNGHITWDVAERALSQDFLPDSISSDLNGAGLTDQVFDFPNVLSKFLMLGMKLDQVILRGTANSAKAIPALKGLGTLKPGSTADITILELKQGDFEFVDNVNTKRTGHQKLFPLCRDLLGLATNPIPIKGALKMLARDTGDRALQRRQAAMLEAMTKLDAPGLYRRVFAEFFADLPGRETQAVGWAKVEREGRPDIYSEMGLAWALYRSGETELAVAHCRAALRLNTPDPVLRYQGALILRAAGDRERSAKLRAQAISIHPNLAGYERWLEKQKRTSGRGRAA
jgi:predicted amidohydrolase